ncbi:MAG: hypothetical protein ACK559_37665 [bacterium]
MVDDSALVVRHFLQACPDAGLMAWRADQELTPLGACPGVEGLEEAPTGDLVGHRANRDTG